MLNLYSFVFPCRTKGTPLEGAKATREPKKVHFYCHMGGCFCPIDTFFAQKAASDVAEKSFVGVALALDILNLIKTDQT